MPRSHRPPRSTASPAPSSTPPGQPVGSNVAAVYLYRWNGSYWDYYDWRYTDSSGGYSFYDISAGDYHVYFSPQDNLHATQYFDDRNQESSADKVTVAVDTLFGDIDAHLQLSGTIAGTITDEPTALPIYYIRADLYRYNSDSFVWELVTAQYTDSSGRYGFTGLHQGTYRIEFSDPAYTLYRGEFWSDKADIDTANDIPLVWGQTRGDIDAVMARETGTGHGASISGAVTAEQTGWELPGTDVVLYSWNGANWQYVANRPTLASGGYLWTGLAAGDYRLRFELGGGKYVAEYFDNAADLESGTTITLTEDQVATGNDAELGLVLNAVTGTVTDELTHEPIANAYVEVSYVWGAYAGSAYTDELGRYAVAGLISNTYKISATDLSGRYFSEYHSDASEWGAATPVVLDGSSAALIDFGLQHAGEITGVVTSQVTGLPIQSAYVNLYTYVEQDDVWQNYGGDYCNEAGEYDFVGLEYGTYRLSLADYTYGHLPEWYDNAPGLLDATDIIVTATPAVANAALAKGGTFSGTVTAASSADPIAGAEISLWDFDPRYDTWYQTTYTAITNALGDYTLSGVPDGSYRVRAWKSGRCAEYYEEVPAIAAATTLSVTAPETIENVDFTLDVGATISGHVQEAVTGTPISSTYVALMRLTIDSYGSESWQTAGPYAYTDASGNYTLTDVPDGTYRIWFAHNTHAQEYYPGERLIWNAQDVLIEGPESVPNMDAQLSPGGSISGTVTDAGLTPLPGVYVRVFGFNSHTQTWEGVTGSYVDSGGHYNFGSLADDSYVLTFHKSGYDGELYDNATDILDATPVAIEDGANVTGRDAALDTETPVEYATLQGTLTGDATGLPAAGVRVIAWRQDLATYGGWYWHNATDSNALGEYSMSLRTGWYRLEFRDESGRYLGEFYQDVPDAADATLFYADADETIVRDASLANAASISGRVIDEPTGDSLQGITVTSYRHGELGWYFGGSTSSDAQGDYAIGGLDAGAYRLRFADETYYDWRAEYYNDKPTLSLADDCLVADGEHRTGIDASLKRNGLISGTVTGGDGRPVGDTSVTFYKKSPDNWNYFTQVATGPDGAYDSGSLEPGTYIVQVSDAWPYGPARYETEYFGDATRTADATQIDVGYDHAIADIQLDSTGTWGDITGTVTDAFTGRPIADMAVRTWYWSAGESAWFAFDPPVTTGADGSYAAQWVPIGTDYRVGVHPAYDAGDGTPWTGIYADTYHLDASNPDDGASVDVLPDTLSPEIDIEVAPEATTGYLTANAIEDGTGTPVAGTHVEFYRFDGGTAFSYVGDGYCSAVGSLTRPLPAGQYAISLNDWPHHAGEFYQDATDLSGSTLVEVLPAGSAEITASLAPLGSVAGTVTASAGGAPLEGIEVTAYRFEGGYWNWYEQDDTDALGAYEFLGMPLGTYRVGFRDYSSAYAPEYFDNAGSLVEALDVPVGAAPLTGISATLEAAATIAGRVTDSVTGEPIEDAYARAFVYNELADNWDEIAGTYTDTLGYYTLVGLPEGTYRVGFEDWYDNHAYEYYDGVRQLEDAASVALVVGQHATGIDATMDRYANVSGTITDVTTGNPVASVYVAIYRWNDVALEWQAFWAAYTDGNGFYRFDNVLPGTYRVSTLRSGYIEEYYNNRYDIDSAQDITAASGQSVTTDMGISPGASIRGTVIDPASDPAGSIMVTAMRWDVGDGQWVGVRNVYTNSSGDYDLWGLGDGIYRVNFYDPTQTLAEEYYNNSLTVTGAADVELINGQDTPDIDAQLATRVPPGVGWAAGTIRSDGDGTPLGNIQVLAKRYVPSSGWDAIGTAITDNDGTYALALEAGTYRFEFRDDSSDHLGEYFDDVTGGEIWDADDVSVSAATTSSIDASLTPAASLRGTVTAAADGLPIGNVNIAAYRAARGSWFWAGGTTTGVDGSYDVGALPAGTYIVEFADNSGVYRSQCFDGAPDMSTATHIDLGAGETRSGIDAALDTNGGIAGSVTDEGGRPVYNARVQLHVDSGGSSYLWQSTSTGTDGSYAFSSLPPGTYFIYADDPWSPYGFVRFNGEYFDDQPAANDATRIVITTQSETADLALESTHTWGSISGTVRDAVSGYPVPDMPVVLYEPNGLGGWTANYNYLTMTDGAGNYRLDYVPLNADAYRLAADPGYGGPAGLVYDLTFYSSASTVELGSDVDLSSEAHLTGIDILAHAKAGVGWVEGTVVSEVTSAPLSGVNVMFYNAARMEVGSVLTRADGTFSRAVLAGQGPFYLEFSDDPGNYVPEWYNDSDYGTADTVAVTAGATSSITASLTPAAHIAGTVRNAGGQLLQGTVLLYTSDGTYVNDTHFLNGTFSFDGLPAGSYKVHVYPSGPYPPEYWENSYTFDTAVPIPLTAGQTANLDFTVASGAFLNGTVSSDDGLLSTGVGVEIYLHTAVGWEYLTSTGTDLGSDYEWTSSALPAGEYRVAFRETFGIYETIWYKGTDDIDTATSIWLDEGETITIDQMLDRLPPTVSSDAVASYDNEATIEISASDLVSGVARIHYLLGAEYHSVEGTHATVLLDTWGSSQSIEFWATDNMGFESQHQLAQFDILDTIAPTVTDDAAATYDEEARIGLTALDTDGGSGVSAIYYRLDDEVDWTMAPGGYADIVVGILGEHTLYYKADDVAGNESGVTQVDFEVLDGTAPEVSDNAVGSYNDSATIRLTASDGGDGVASISYSMDDDEDWTVVNAAIADVVINDPGEHTLWYKATDLAGNDSDEQVTNFTIVRTLPVEQVPIAGDNRFATAVAVSEQAFPDGCEWVVIATGRNWPDALGGSALAGALGGPILLTDTSAMPASVVDEIDRLDATKAVILGGTAAVNASVETALNTLLGNANVERIAGSNRYLTADAVGARTIDELGAGYDGTAFMATGANYPDALAAAPLSAGLHWPLFLTKTTGIAAETYTAMGGVEEVLVLGGTSAVPTSIESALNTRYGNEDVTRLAGANRYSTAVAVATHGVANGLGWNRLALATGEKFPDALAGGVLQGLDGSVMLLTKSGYLDPNVADVLTSNKALISEVRYLGGMSAISQDVRDEVANILD